MTDKLRRTAPLNIQFQDGEQPTAAKLNALNNQSRQALLIIEKAVGDLWNQSGDSILNDIPLKITNLARVLGEQQKNSISIFPPNGTFRYNDPIGANNPGKTEAFITLPFDSNAAGVTTDASNHPIDASPKSNRYDLADSGDWYLDGTTGKAYFFDPLHSSQSIRYTVDPDQWVVNEQTMPNIIPDEHQEEFTGCRISTQSGKVYIHLPPRRPLNLPGSAKPDRYPDNYEIPPSATGTINQATTTGEQNKLWQSSSVNALAKEHYRYRLPKEINDVLNSLSAGDQLPAGFMYLWDNSTGTIIDDAIFRKSSLADWVFEVSSDTKDLSAAATTDESASSYNSSPYSIICAGSPISRVINFLFRVALGSRNGGVDGSFERIRSHEELKDVNPPHSDATSHTGRYPTYIPGWQPSRWSNDDHTSLLSRLGANTSSSLKRDLWNNAMLGHFLLANADESGSYNFLDNSVPDNSYKIYFGDTTGNYIYGTSTGIEAIAAIAGDVGFKATGAGTTSSGSDGLQGVGGSVTSVAGTGGIGVKGTGGDSIGSAGADGGVGVQGTGGNSAAAAGAAAGGTGVKGIGYSGTPSGYGVEARGKTTSPTRASLFVLPQPTPSEVTAGGVSFDDTSNKLVGANGDAFEHYIPQTYVTTSTTDTLTGDGTFQDFASTYSIPANTLRIGSTIRVKLWIRPTDVTGVGDITTRVSILGKTLTASASTPATTSDPMFMEVCATIRTIGASGTMAMSSMMVADDSQDSQSSTFGSVDTTSAGIVKIQCQTNNNTDVILDQMIVDVT